MKSRIFGVVSIALLLFASSMTSCNKVEDTIATIKVTNVAGDPVSGASVTLSGGVILETKKTNTDGKASFDFSSRYQQGQAGFAILDIDVSKGALTGSGIIKIVEMKTNEETVIIE